MSEESVGWKNYRKWYNDRIMETYISAPIIDKQNDLIEMEKITLFLYWMVLISLDK